MVNESRHKSECAFLLGRVKLTDLQNLWFNPLTLKALRVTDLAKCSMR